jgi:hypothetical protein
MKHELCLGVSAQLGQLVSTPKEGPSRGFTQLCLKIFGNTGQEAPNG